LNKTRGKGDKISWGDAIYFLNKSNPELQVLEALYHTLLK